jgi:hypothetical protein
LPDFAAAGVLYGNGWTGIVDEQFFAGPVFLPQDDFLLSPPSLVEFTKTAIPIAFRILRAILLPDQLQSEMLMLLQLGVDRWEIRRWKATSRRDHWRGRRECGQ